MRIVIFMLAALYDYGYCQSFGMPLQATSTCQILLHYTEANKEIIGGSVYFVANIAGLRKHFKIRKDWGADFATSVRVTEKSQADAIYDAFEVLGYSVTRYTVQSHLPDTSLT